MTDILFSPARRFAFLKEHPVWLAPFLLALFLPLLIGTLATTFFPRERLIAGVESRITRVKEFIDQQVEKGRMPSDQREAALERIEQSSRPEIDFYSRATKPALFFRFLIRGLPAVIWSALFLIIWTTILNLFLPLLGATASFGRTLAVTANAALIRIISSLFRAVLMLVTGNLTVATSLAPLLPHGPIYLRGILAGIDIFTIWELVLVSIGLAVVFNSKPRNTALIVFAIWFGYLLLLAGMVTLSGGIALQ